MEQANFGGINENWIKRKLQIIEIGEKKQVLVKGHSYMSWMKYDESSERLAIAQLYDIGLASQDELAQAFGFHVNTIAKYINVYRSEGAKGLIEQARGPKEKWKINPEMRGKILIIFLKEGIKNLLGIQKKLKEQWNKEVSIESIRQVLKEGGFIREGMKTDKVIMEGDLFGYCSENMELELFKDKGNDEIGTKEIKEEINIEDNNVEIPCDVRVKDKRKDSSYYSPAQRMYMGQLEQTSSGLSIERGEYNSYAAGLLYVPFISRYNFIATMKKVINVKTYEGYSLEELCLTLFYFDVFGFRSVENFKTVYPEEYGLLIGKLSSPSIVTLRRFLHKVRELKKGEELIEEFTKQYLKMGLANCIVVYIDGHFLPYWGIEIIRKGFHTIRDMPMKGSYNFIANDEDFNPIIFLIRSSDEGLIRKVPEIINKLKKLAKEIDLDVKDMTVIFDRGGFSAELFRWLDDREGQGQNKVNFYTWGKNIDDWVKKFKGEEFIDCAKVKYKVQKSEEVKYIDTDRQVNKYGKMRAIAIMSGKNKMRSVVYTNDWDADAKIIIQRMCSRWGQENLIKALKLRHLIDYHPGYVSEELDEQPLVDNPDLIELKQERSRLKNQLHELELELTEKICKDTKDNTIWKDVKEKEIELFSDVAVKKSEITLISQKIDELPKEKKYDEVHDGEKLCELDYEKKRFLDCIKVFAYHMQKQMCQILLNYFPVKKEVYSALDMIIKRGADVRLEDGKLIVRLKRFKDVYIDYAARHLCKDLNKTEPVTLDRFRLPIRYEVA